MEGLWGLGKLSFDQVRFGTTPGSTFDCYSLSESATLKASSYYEECVIHEASLVGFARQGQDTNTNVASFRLLCILRDSQGGLGIKKDSFLQLVTSMKLDPHILYLISRDYDGFHHCTGGGGSEAILVGFVGNSRFSLTWTFDSRTMSTRGLVFVRRSSPFPELGTIMNQAAFRSLIWTPMLPIFLVAIHTIRTFDNETAAELSKIREIEKQTGYGPDNPLPPKQRVEIDLLSMWLRDIGAIQGHFANKHRHLDVVNDMVSFMQKDSWLNGKQPGSTSYMSPLALQNTNILRESLPTMQQMVNSQKAYFSYLQERTRTISSVLFSLLTHEDAATNLELADASYAIAEASKRDSSSMKTIAVMTMAFLPATFLSSLFAVPSLQWDQQKVIQPRFWVYWAFTIPATVMVFLAWFVITNYRLLLKKIRNIEGRTGDENHEMKNRRATRG